MRPQTILLLAALVAPAANCLAHSVVYVSPIGDDRHPGTSPDLPWRTLDRVQQALNEGQFSAGGEIRLARGSVFTGTLALRNLHIPTGGSLLLSAYGEGPPPTITGFTPLHDWESFGGGRFRARCPECAAPPAAITRDGTILPIARYPNLDEADSGYLDYQSSEGRTSVTSDHLATGADWTGAETVLRSAAWILDRLPVARHLGPTLTFSTPSTYDIPKGYGFFLQNHPAALDRDGEWTFDPASRSITVLLSNSTPERHHFAATVTDTLLSVSNCQGIEISDLRLSGARRANLEIQNSTRVSIRWTESLQAGDTGLRCANCRGLLIEDSLIDEALNHGLDVFNCADCLVERNRIANIATIAGMGRSGNGQYNGVRFGGVDTVFRRNTVQRTGYLGIDVRGGARIEENFVSEANLVKTDGGGIYTWGNRGVDIVRNLVTTSYGSKAGVPWNNPATHGIYIDDQCEDMRVTDNTIVSVASHGVYLHNTKAIDVERNTIIDSGDAQIAFVDDHLGAHTVSETNVKDNLFLSRLSGSLLARASTNAGPAFFPNIGVLSGNRYCLPFAEPAFYATMPGLQSRLSFDQWRSLTASDSDSEICPHRYPPYRVIETTGANRVANSTFEANIGSWFGWPSASLEARWDAGRLRLRHTAGAPILHYDAPIGLIEKGRFYRVRFDAQSDQPRRSLRVYLRKWDPDYRLLAPAADLPLDHNTRSWEFVFQATETEPRGLLIFELPNSSQIVWLDNVRLEPVDARETPRNELVRVEVNPTFEHVEIHPDQGGAPVLIGPLSALVVFAPPTNESGPENTPRSNPGSTAAAHRRQASDTPCCLDRKD